MTPIAATEAERIIPCPFCGGDAFTQNGPPELWYVQCVECRIDGHVMKSERDAIAAWNRRPSRALQQTAEPVKPEGWLIEWTSAGGIKERVFHRHNCIGDYRAQYPDAVSCELVRAAPDRAPSTDSAADTRDAARFRWLASIVTTEDRDGGYSGFYRLPNIDWKQARANNVKSFYHKSFESAIDAAIAASLPQTKEE